MNCTKMNCAKMNFIKIEPMYQTEEGLEFITNPNDTEFIIKQCELGKFKMAFHIHSVTAAGIYAIFNIDQWTINEDLYRYLCLSRQTKEDLYDLLIEGKFDIGIARVGSYHVIKEITPYSHDDNNEIRLHYTEPRTFEGNVAWRSITWDAFKDIVDEINSEE
jgi:hypothetical protein